MSNELADEIIKIVRSEANNNPAPERCVITKVYEDKNHCDVKTNLGELKYVDVIGSNIKKGDNAVILYFDENFEDYVVIADTNDNITTNDITELSALNNLQTPANATQHEINLKINEKINSGGGGGSIIMVGSFEIDNNGHLIVTIPDGASNPYHIDNNGHLIYSTGSGS